MSGKSTKVKKATATMNAVLGDEDRLKALAEDFAKHYEKTRSRRFHRKRQSHVCLCQP